MFRMVVLLLGKVNEKKGERGAGSGDAAKPLF